MNILDEIKKALHDRCIVPLGSLFIIVALGRIILGILNAIANSTDGHSRKITAFAIVKGITGLLSWAWILYNKNEHIGTLTVLISVFDLGWLITGSIWLFTITNEYTEHSIVVLILKIATIADWTIFGFYVLLVAVNVLRRYLDGSPSWAIQIILGLHLRRRLAFCGALQKNIVQLLRKELAFCGVLLGLACIGRFVFGIFIAGNVFDELSLKDHSLKVTFLVVKGTTGLLFWCWIWYRRNSEDLSTFTLVLSLFNFVWMILGTVWVFDVSYLQEDHYGALAVLQIVTITDWALFALFVCFVTLKTLREKCEYNN